MNVIEYVIDAYDCQTDVNDSEYLLKVIKNSAKKVNANVVNQLTHKYSPFGVSLVVFLAESHISIYTWPEYKFAIIKIFLCNDKMDPEIVWQNIKNALLPKKFKIKKVEHKIC